MGTLEQPALIGRDPELERIAAAIEAGREEPVGVVIAGEPGIGKTRLLRALAERARAAGSLVFSGRAAEFDRDTPFVVLADAIEAPLGELNPRLFRGLGAEAASELVRAFPGLGGLLDAGDVSPLQDERHRLHAAFRELLARLATWKPTVLVLDDLHWADDASLELISFLLRRPAPAPVTIALALRPAQAPELLRAALADARAERLVETIDLGPLSESLAAPLLAALEPSSRATVYREAGGNPFYLEQLAKAPYRASGAGRLIEGVPAAVVAAIEAEVRGLDEAARHLLEAGSVLGERFDADLAEAVAGLEPGELGPALDALSAAELILESEPRRFRFRHPIVRRAVYEGVPSGSRLEAHGRAAAALRDSGAGPLALARHVEASASAGDEEAIAILRAAAEAASPRAPAAAARWFDATLRLLAEDDPRRLELLIAMATALGSAGQLRQSRDTLRLALAELPPELEPLRLRVIPFVALIEHLLGEHEAARGTLERTLSALPAEATADAAVMRLEIAADRFYMNDDALAKRAGEALATASAADDPLLVAEATGLRALGEYKLGEIEAAERDYAEAARMVGALEDLELAPRLLAVLWLGWYGQCGERHEAGVGHMERALAISRLTGQGHLLVPAMIGQAICLTALGNLSRATEMADQTIEMARLAINDQSLAWSLTLRSWIASTAGDVPLAVRCGEEAVRVVERIADSYFSRLAGCYLGEALVEAGDPERARDSIMTATGAELEPLERAYRPHFYEVLAQAEIALGDHRAARGWAERACADVDGLPLPGRTGEALRARAAVELAEGLHPAAAETGIEAAQSFAAREQRVDAARARLLAGRALARAGHERDAVATLGEAHRELDRCGARRHADLAARELRRLGLRVRRAAARGPGGSGLDSLSDREREVAALVAQGRTNREVAAELHVAEKTVETHLSRIYRKLDIARRAQLGTLIAERAASADLGD